MKKIIALLLTFTIVLAFSACGNSGVVIPDVSGTDADTAKNLLSSNQLVPVVEEQYNDTVEKGLVIETSPYSGTEVEPNSRVTIYVSKGPSCILSSDSTMSWKYVGSNSDYWEFSSPYIQEGTLYIECTATFGTSFEFKNGGFGNAAITDTFDKYVPIQLTVSNQYVTAGEEQTITFAIPLADLDVDKPTSIYTSSNIIINGSEKDLIVSFSMSWG